MSKYDFEIDLSPTTSTGIILNKIQKGSVVLEFGCATGRMTRYMKEALGCDVYIVEYEASAFEKAKVYAKDGLCDDIMTFSWHEKFQKITFDAIIFADVLEHLSAPEKVLEKAAELLAEDGCIYTSIPNVTHNDIVLKSIEEHFDYTATGILDDTHIHFWGQKNLEELAEKAGLHIRTLEATYCPTGYTEQYGQAGHQGSLLLENALKERTGGEVYQFVFALEKNKTAETVCLLKKPCITSHIYLDTGKDFNAEEMIAFESLYTAKDTCRSHYVLEAVENVRRLRFDPVEFQGCILKNLEIRQGETSLKFSHSEGVETAEGLLLLGPDPMISVELSENQQPVVIEAEVLLWGEEYIGILQNHTLIMRDLLEESERKNQERERNHQENEARYEKQIGGLQMQMQEIQMNLLSYIKVANSKDKYAMALEKELNDYKNLRVVKMYFFVKRILKAIKKRIKRLIGKEENE